MPSASLPRSPARVRDARPEDYAEFTRLFPELAVADPVASAERFEAEIMPTTVIAEDERGRVVGYAHYRWLAQAVHLAHIVAAPEARRSGAGRALMASVVDRARARGMIELQLNVKPHNTAAIRLYESFGLTPRYESKSLRVDWALVEALAPSEIPHVARVRELGAEDDARCETDLGFAAGRFSSIRGKEGRVFSAIETDGRFVAGAVFDPSFPGAYPFGAVDAAHAWSLLRALRAHARPDLPVVNLPIEGHAALADALLARGAKLYLDIVHMRGPIT